MKILQTVYLGSNRKNCLEKIHLSPILKIFGMVYRSFAKCFTFRVINLTESTGFNSKNNVGYLKNIVNLMK